MQGITTVEVKSGGLNVDAEQDSQGYTPSREFTRLT
jgi:hypothetical protein